MVIYGTMNLLNTDLEELSKGISHPFSYQSTLDPVNEYQSAQFDSCNFLFFIIFITLISLSIWITLSGISLHYSDRDGFLHIIQVLHSCQKTNRIFV